MSGAALNENDDVSVRLEVSFVKFFRKYIFFSFSKSLIKSKQKSAVTRHFFLNATAQFR
jgi:hypothetical protein